jgi:hypothetical protein
MKISTASIDCVFQINGPSNYNDYQHHRWDIGASATIGTALGNKLTYTWTLTCVGSNTSGGWSAIIQSKTVGNGAEVVIEAASKTDMTPVVKLTQTMGAGTNNLPTTGSNHHPVDEMPWPKYPDLSWLPTVMVPSEISFRDMGQQPNSIFPITFGPDVVVPTGQTGFGSVGGVFLRGVINLGTPTVPNIGIGGRDASGYQATKWQMPSGSTVRAWWAWIIKLGA